MKKYYMIKDIITGLYLKAMSNTEWVSPIDAGTWPSVESAKEWISNIKDRHLTIEPVYINHS